MLFLLLFQLFVIFDYAVNVKILKKAVNDAETVACR